MKTGRDLYDEVGRLVIKRGEQDCLHRQIIARQTVVREAIIRRAGLADPTLWELDATTVEDKGHELPQHFVHVRPLGYISPKPSDKDGRPCLWVRATQGAEGPELYIHVDAGYLCLLPAGKAPKVLLEGAIPVRAIEVAAQALHDAILDVEWTHDLEEGAQNSPDDWTLKPTTTGPSLWSDAQKVFESIKRAAELYGGRFW